MRTIEWLFIKPRADTDDTQSKNNCKESVQYG